MFPSDGATAELTYSVALISAVRYAKSVAPAALVGYFLGVAGVLGQQVGTVGQ